MDGLLVEDVAVECSVEEPGWMSALRQEVLSLREEFAELRRENAELRQQVGYWKSRHADAVHRIAEREAEAEQLRGENRKLQSQLFGKKSEQSASKSKDRSNQLDGVEEKPSPPRRRGQQSGRPGPSRRDYSHLPVIEELQELPEAQRACPQCGVPLTPSNTQDSEQIEIEVKAYRRLIRRRRYQRTCNCQGPATKIAPPPAKLIPKSLLGVSVWVEILLGKFHDHQPVERQLTHWKLLGLDLAAGTVIGGLQRLEPLFTPLYETLLARNAQAGFAQADETRWQVFIDFEGKTGHRWWLWVFLSGDTVVFILDPHRSHDVPEGHFARPAPSNGEAARDSADGMPDGAIDVDFAPSATGTCESSSSSHDHVPQGHFAQPIAAATDAVPKPGQDLQDKDTVGDAAPRVLMVDRYSAYKAMAQVKLGTILLAFCWAHVRRDFVEVGKGWPELKDWAVAWLRRIRDLYQCQRRRLAHQPGSAEYQAADSELRQVLAAMKAQAELELADPKLRQPCRKALESLQVHWAGLTLFVDDLRIPMDNNAAERANRGPAVSRKNYYGSGALWSGRLAAMMFSTLATLKLWKLNPRKWLTWYLQSCADNGGKAPADITPFLPWNLTQEQRQVFAISPENSPANTDTS